MSLASNYRLFSVVVILKLCQLNTSDRSCTFSWYKK